MPQSTLTFAPGFEMRQAARIFDALVYLFATDVFEQNINGHPTKQRIIYREMLALLDKVLEASFTLQVFERRLRNCDGGPTFEEVADHLSTVMVPAAEHRVDCPVATTWGAVLLEEAEWLAGVVYCATGIAAAGEWCPHIVLEPPERHLRLTPTLQRFRSSSTPSAEMSNY